MAGKHKKTIIREDLVDQLERKGIYGSHYIDLIEDYISMWEIKNELINDIKKRGVTLKYQNGKSQWGHKRNDSISELNKTNAQMLKLLNELNLKAGDFEMADDEDEEM